MYGDLGLSYAPAPGEGGGRSEAVSHYLEQQVATATPAQLIDMLFDRACRDLASAGELLSAPQSSRDTAEGIRLVVHAQEIVAALHRSLNFKEGGDLARNLSRVYEYIQYQLNQAVEGRQAEGVGECRGLLSELHEAWHTILLQEQAGAAAGQKASLSGILVA